MGKRLKKIISLPLPPDLLARLNDRCTALGVDRTRYITGLIEQSLNPVISESEFYKFVSGGKFSSAKEIREHNEGVFEAVDEANEKLSKEMAESMAKKLEQLRKEINERKSREKKSRGTRLAEPDKPDIKLGHCLSKDL